MITYNKGHIMAISADRLLSSSKITNVVSKTDFASASESGKFADKAAKSLGNLSKAQDRSLDTVIPASGVSLPDDSVTNLKACAKPVTTGAKMIDLGTPDLKGMSDCFKGSLDADLELEGKPLKFKGYFSQDCFNPNFDMSLPKLPGFDLDFGMAGATNYLKGLSMGAAGASFAGMGLSNPFSALNLSMPNYNWDVPSWNIGKGVSSIFDNMCSVKAGLVLDDIAKNPIAVKSAIFSPNVSGGILSNVKDSPSLTKDPVGAYDSLSGNLDAIDPRWSKSNGKTNIDKVKDNSYVKKLAKSKSKSDSASPNTADPSGGTLSDSAKMSMSSKQPSNNLSFLDKIRSKAS